MQLVHQPASAVPQHNAASTPVKRPYGDELAKHKCWSVGYMAHQFIFYKVGHMAHQVIFDHFIMYHVATTILNWYIHNAFLSSRPF